jgi:hypothetical protein
MSNKTQKRISPQLNFSKNCSFFFFLYVYLGWQSTTGLTCAAIDDSTGELRDGNPMQPNDAEQIRHWQGNM